MWIPLILVGIILGVVLLRKYNVKMPVIAVSMPPVSGRVIAWVFGGIVALVAAVWLYSKVSLSDLGGVDINLWIGIAILLILAVRGLIKIKSNLRMELAALVIVGGGLLFFGADAPKVWKKVQGGVSSVVLSESKSAKDDAPSDKPLGPIPQGRNWETKSVVWDEMNPDGSIPINTPSATIQIPDYCTVLYADGIGREFQVLYRAIEGGWEPHQRGQHTPGDAFRIMVIKKGVKEITYRQSCP